MASMRPLNSSHWLTGLISTGATLTEGGGGAPVSLAWPPLQPARMASDSTLAAPRARNRRVRGAMSMYLFMEVSWWVGEEQRA